jgi:hypothetical protein
MPLGPGVRYRWKNGVRLAFKGNTVVETKKKGKGHSAHLTKAGKTVLKRHR